MPGKLHHKDGFTLIELMIAMLVMAITALALYYMFNQGQILMAEQEHRCLVFEKAQKRMAVYKLLSDQHLIVPGTYSGAEDVVIEPMDNENGNPEVTLAAEYVARVVEGEGLYNVEVKYTWTEFSGRDYEITLMSDFFIEPTGGS